MQRSENEGAFLAGTVDAWQLDGLLARGWRHFGTLFFFCHTTQEIDESGYLETRDVRALRVDLTRFRRSRSQRRTWRQNMDLDWRITSLDLRADVRALFDQHKSRFRADVPEGPETFLGHDPTQTPTDTRQLEVYQDSGQLAAVSFIDLGAQSLSSIYACYDLALADRRLGVHTMLLEIEWAISRGLRYYYPGYAFIQPSGYDYKKELGALEYYDWQSWKPWQPGDFMS